MTRTRVFSPSPPQRGEGRGGGVVSFASLTPPTLPSPARVEDIALRLDKCLADGLENTFHIGLYVPVPKAKGFETSLLEIIVSRFIFLAARMLASIYFNNQLFLKANKIHDVRPHGLLTTEGKAQLIALEALPKQPFLRGHPFSQTSSQLSKFLVRHTKSNYPKNQQTPPFTLLNRQILPPQRGRVGWGVV